MRLLNTFGVVGLIACSGDKPEPAANSAPIFTSVEITPSEEITASTELLYIATATDDDNDDLEIFTMSVSIHSSRFSFLRMSINIEKVLNFCFVSRIMYMLKE